MKIAEIKLENEIFAKLEREAKKLNLSVSDYINKLIVSSFKKETLIDEVAGMWRDRDISLKEIRDFYKRPTAYKNLNK